MPEFPPAFNAPIASAGGWLAVSGQLAMQGGHLIEGGIGPETERVIDNIEQLLESEGARLQHVVKINVYLADLDDYAVMNETMARRFGAHRPARTTIGAQLVRGARVEMEVWAYTGSLG
ncbi:RidA family protein [bacterium]|nr:MAG: RidA family protein [bacterium]